MLDVIGERLFAALRGAAEQRLGRDHPCFAALDKAAGDTGPAVVQAVQAALAALEPSLAAALMADAHKALRENPQGILGSWSGGSRPH